MDRVWPRFAASIRLRVGRSHDREGGPGITFLDLKTEAGRLVNGYRNESLRLTAPGLWPSPESYGGDCAIRCWSDASCFRR